MPLRLPPYDFALGGEGLDPSLPISVNGALLQPGQSFMVDMGGNFYGYMGDMSRVFSIGKLPEKAYVAHQVCLDIQKRHRKRKPVLFVRTFFTIRYRYCHQSGLC